MTWLKWHVKRKNYEKIAPDEQFHEIITRRFGELTIFSVGEQAAATTREDNANIPLPARCLTSLPIEVFEELAMHLTLPEIRWLTRTIGVPHRYHAAMACRVRTSLAPFLTPEICSTNASKLVVSTSQGMSSRV